ncbi:MAG: D-alanine--D-alanine ligase [Spirochaetia bacterium]|nr:D-alanine--D-alanine ligase [Spirochaetia bacterium]
MTIGLSYDLKSDYAGSGLSPEALAEFDSEETVAGIEAAIRARGHATRRIGNIRALAARLVAGETWDFVFNIAEGLSGPGRESQVPCLLEAWGIPCSFSDPLVLALCLHKGMAKRVIRDAGLATPAFAVLETAEAAREVNLPYPLFAKPVAEGTGKGISAASKIESPAGLEQAARELLARFRQPVLVETFLPGREFTVGITGTGQNARVVGCMEIHYGGRAEGGVYSYANKADYGNRVSYTPGRDESARRAAGLALDAYLVLGCRDGGRADIRCDAAGEPGLIEINPLAGLNPIHSDLPIAARLSGLSYDGLIGEILESGLKRART